MPVGSPGEEQHVCLDLPAAARRERERHGVDPVDELLREATRRDLPGVRAENLLLELMLRPGPRNAVAVPAPAAHVARPTVAIHSSLPPGGYGLPPGGEHLLNSLGHIVDLGPSVTA